MLGTLPHPPSCSKEGRKWTESNGAWQASNRPARLELAQGAGKFCQSTNGSRHWWGPHSMLHHVYKAARVVSLTLWP